MGVVWGLILVAIGGLFIFWGRTRSEFVVYRLLVARSRLAWGDRVHGFYQMFGGLMIAFGALVAITA